MKKLILMFLFVGQANAQMLLPKNLLGFTVENVVLDAAFKKQHSKSIFNSVQFEHFFKNKTSLYLYAGRGVSNIDHSNNKSSDLKLKTQAGGIGYRKYFCHEKVKKSAFFVGVNQNFYLHQPNLSNVSSEHWSMTNASFGFVSQLHRRLHVSANFSPISFIVERSKTPESAEPSYQPSVGILERFGQNIGIYLNI